MPWQLRVDYLAVWSLNQDRGECTLRINNRNAMEVGLHYTLDEIEASILDGYQARHSRYDRCLIGMTSGRYHSNLCTYPNWDVLKNLIAAPSVDSDGAHIQFFSPVPAGVSADLAILITGTSEPVPVARTNYSISRYCPFALFSENSPVALAESIGEFGRFGCVPVYTESPNWAQQCQRFNNPTGDQSPFEDTIPMFELNPRFKELARLFFNILKFAYPRS